MFSSSPFDKSCVGPDNCSPGRHNSPNRFPVGITSLGDENQQSRIQLAVHKYNSSANTVPNSRCALISPVRHNYLKTSLKAKNYEGDTDGISKSEKKNGNQYEGVGAFPTIHLKKSAVRYRPIKKFNDVKIPYPELPVNRFLSHLPEVCSDLKSGTRSVLDVLEDLSGKKIHSKQDGTANKLKSRGLGGDNLLNPNAVYKPLFVQKPKLSSVLTRDNTTQTLCPPSVETPGPQISNSCNKNDDSDPRAELRRKLAKQNNEIFASLSSSISTSFALKRKLDKVLPARDDEPLNGLAIKKSKMSDQELNNYSENGIPKPNRSKTNSNESIKSTRKNKLSETSTPTSPNKDRLTTIFLDMQSTSPKSQIFQNQSTTTEKPKKNDTQTSTSLSNGFTVDSPTNKISNPLVNGSTGTSTAENGQSESENSSSSEKAASPESKNPESEQTTKPMFNFPLSKAEGVPKEVTKFTSPTFQFGINTTNGANFNLQKTPAAEGSSSNDISNGTKIESNLEKKENGNQVLNTLFTFGKPNEKPAFGAFKFGTEEKAPLPALITSPKDPAPQTSNAPIVTITSSPATPQFSFVATTSAATTQPSNNVTVTQTSGFQFGATTTTKAATATTQQPSIVSTTQTAVQFGTTTSPPTLSISTKPPFTIGQIASPNQENVASDKTTEKAALPNVLQTTATTQSALPGTFNFGQKSSFESVAKSVQNGESQTGKTIQSNAVGFSSSTTNLTTNSTVTSQGSKSLFSFGQKAENLVSTTEEQKISFSFGQKSEADQNKAQEGTGQKSTNLFSFGQKSTAQDSTKSTVTSPAVTSQPASTQPTFVFGQSVSQSATGLQVNFGKTSTQVANGLGAKSEAGFLTSTSTPGFSQSNTTFPIKTPLFGSSVAGFGSPSTQVSAGFGTSTSSASGLSFGSPAVTQSVPAFDTSATQGGLTFGASSTAQSASGFGSSPALQSTSAFGVSNTTQSTFGVPSTTQATFGVPSTSQSTFGVSSTSQSTSAFGVSTTAQSTPAFGVSTTTQPTPSFGVSSPSPPSSAFGAPASSVCRFPAQPNTTFGVPAVTSSSGFGTSQPSFSQPLANKPTTSLGQPSNVFGQNPGPSFSTPAFGTGQSNVFGQKSSREGDVFDQNKIQAPSFNTQNKFSFGMSTSNAAGFTTSPPKTTAAPVFSFGSTTGGNTFAFGGSSSSSTNNTQMPFAFKGATNEPFKFGATNTKEESAPAFAATSSSAFTFGGQMNNNTMAEQKPAFSFGNTQVSSSAPFNFGTTPSPSLFSFGGSSAGSSGSSFNFGTTTPGTAFGQTSSATPGTPFAVPGTFSIGSGSSQSRPRATSRPRRRP